MRQINFFLRIKPWQLFILIFIIPFAIQIVGIASIAIDLSLMVIAMMMMIAFLVVVYCGWFYALGVNLNNRLPDTVKMNLTIFKWFLFFPIVYLVIYIVFIFGSNGIIFNDGPSGGFTFYDRASGVTIFQDVASDPTSLSSSFFAFLSLIMFPLFLLAVFCMFYCLNFAVKSLKAVELQRPVTFIDYIAEFILMLLSPIGVWVIQPRINAMFAETVKDVSI